MEELRQEFLTEAIASLEKLRAELCGEIFSDEALRETFRTLHTLKGTSQTFNLNIPGRLAHELENLLQAKRENPLAAGDDFAPLLKEGIDLLLDAFRRSGAKQEAEFPIDFVENLRLALPDHSLPADDLSGVVPPQFLSQLSSEEKKSLTSALASAKRFYLIEAGFAFADFAEKFRALRETLSENGEVVANFPSPKFAAENKIGFQIFYVSAADGDKIGEKIQPFGANFVFQNNGDHHSKDLQGVLKQAVVTGKKTALSLGKTIEFEVSADALEVSSKRLKLLSDALLHLVRNAVDHAIEKEGKIKIRLSLETSGLVLRVADDGRGIAAEKIRARAIEKNLIVREENLADEEIINLIFEHGFSTSDRVTEISGRGVGLDAVRDAIEKAGGTIRVESQPGEGATFEIRLPEEI